MLDMLNLQPSLSGRAPGKSRCTVICAALNTRSINPEDQPRTLLVSEQFEDVEFHDGGQQDGPASCKSVSFGIDAQYEPVNTCERGRMLLRQVKPALLSVME